MQQKGKQSEPMRYETENRDDEIELIDIFRVIWKWKYLIIGGTVACAVAALIISSMMPKIYQIETLIQPGILSFNEDGNSIYIDTPDNIKALIEAGTFNLKIINMLANKGATDIPKILDIGVAKQDGSNTLKIIYETSQIEQGIEILELLGKFLIEEYSNFVKFFQQKIDKDLNIAKAEIEHIRSIRRSSENKINNIDKRIIELKTEIISVNENTNDLKKERIRLLEKKQNEGNILSAILYSNTIQQNLQLENDYENEIKNLMIEKETEIQKNSNLEANIQKQLSEIGILRYRKNNIQNVRILQEPHRSPSPISPKTKLNVILAAFVGLLIMVFLSFFLEFLSKHKLGAANDE